MKIEPKRVLVFGGNSFVGKMVVEALTCFNCSVTVIHRSPNKNQCVECIIGDRSCTNVYELAKAFEPDVIVDFSMYLPEYADSISSLVNELNAHYIAISSASIYKDFRAVEGSTIESNSGWGDYGRNKATSDELLRQAIEPENMLLFRPTYFVGVGNPIKRCNFVFDCLHKGEVMPLPGDGSSKIQLVCAEDLTSLILEAVSRKLTGVYNVGGCDFLTVRRFAEICSLAAGIEIKFEEEHSESEIYDELRWPFPALNLVVNQNKLFLDFETRFKSAEQIVSNCYRHFRKYRTQ